MIIHAFPKGCNTEYSITGITGPFQKDSIFVIGKSTAFSVYVKNSKCSSPVAYNGPVQPLPAVQPPPVVKPYTPRPVAVQDDKVYENEQNDNRIFPLGISSSDELSGQLKEKLKADGISGTFTLEVIIDSDGSVNNIKISGTVNGNSDQIKRAVRGFGNWTTGLNHGQIVKTRVSIPVSL